MNMMATTGITLSDKEFGMLEEAQEQGLMRAVGLLSQMTYTKKSILVNGVFAAANIAGAGYKLGTGASHQVKGHSVADNEIKKLLNAAFKKCGESISKNKTIRQACAYTGMALTEVMMFLKSILLSETVLATLVPLYGNVRGVISGASQAIEAHTKSTHVDDLRAMEGAIAPGLPTAALKAFTKYVRAEMVRTAAKSAYTMTKSIAGILAEIFTFGAWTVVTFVNAIVDAVMGFLYTWVQAELFTHACDRFNIYRVKQENPTAAEFRALVEGSSFVGAVFFGAANYIGHFNLCSVLSEPKRVVTSQGLMSAVMQVNDAQKMACGYVRGVGFSIGFRDAAAEKRYGWVRDMINGYGGKALHTSILNEDANMWTKFKHKAKLKLKGQVERKV